MCNNFPNIKVVEGNAFSVLVPLKVRTFESCSPIDEDIDPTQLSNVVFKFGGVSYTPIVDERGVSAVLPATLARGAYDIVLTANYGDNPIRAAYESAITIVPWNSQSDAQQYIAGSPIVLDAAYVIGGTLTDAELEALKEEYREKNAQLDQAIADAEEAKREWEQKAADLEGVAQESTSQEILTAVENIDIDTSDLAKEATSQEILQTMQPIGAIGGELESGKAAIASAIEQRGGQASAEQSLGELAQGVLNIPNILTGQSRMIQGITQLNLADYCLTCGGSNAAVKNIFIDLYSEITSGISQYSMESCTNLRTITLPYYDSILTRFFVYTNVEKFIAPFALLNNSELYFYQLSNLKVIDVSSTHLVGGSQGFNGCVNLVDMKMGAGFESSVSFGYYNPTEAYRTDTASLCFDTDIEEYGQLFSTNFDKWKWCMINHFAANLQDRTGLTAYTITFGSTALSHFDAEMIAAFTDKNWTLA